MALVDANEDAELVGALTPTMKNIYTFNAVVLVLALLASIVVTVLLLGLDEANQDYVAEFGSAADKKKSG